ncbi:MAG: hypothetical protein AVO34_09130 [Firmicutes bacterium ML8_F2]|nr:MAG: hypothetical protein AVO34_09130 [Firmicutes bacterium ML8_F2]
MEHLARILLIGGGVIASLGLLLLLLSRLGLGRLPGDIFIQRENLTFYFPLATMILLSIVITLLLNLLRR